MRMRHILAVIFAILVLAVPWLMYHPDQADLIFSKIQPIGDQLAAVILSHLPKSILDIRSHYNSKPGIFASAGSSQKVRILIVPGHEPDYGGAEYGSLKERNMTVELANDLKNFISQNDRYEVFVTRDDSSWKPIFADYFKNNWSDIAAWVKLHKDEIVNLTRLGEYRQVAPPVIHNNASNDVALRLFGIDKWANENNVDIVLHIHFNDYAGHGNGPGEYSGFAIYVPQREYFNSTTTKALADTVFKRLKKYNAVSDLPGESSGIVEDQDLIAIGAFNSVDAASMLVEYGYIYEPQFTNAELRSAALNDLAFQTYLGLQDFFDDHSALSANGSFDTLVMPHSWSDPLSEKSSNNADVYALQTALLLDGDYPPTGSSLNDCPRTGKLGNCTKAALETFQKKRGISGEKGIVGTKTLQELNKKYSVRAI